LSDEKSDEPRSEGNIVLRKKRGGGEKRKG